jgi:hypothetical protein
MNRSVIAQGSQKVNRRSKLAVNLTEVDAQLVALSNIVTFQDVEIVNRLLSLEGINKQQDNDPTRV